MLFFGKGRKVGPRNGERPERELRPFSLTRQYQWMGQLSERTIAQTGWFPQEKMVSPSEDRQ
ncbi:hypothetical protein HK12_10005 [Acetobacter orientalis]|uniref:Uncharacterized protein n=1 Tax=Acetobacter orientalis TaxID=146474 RepID=A0A251ZZL6_9PROT|nr:hypothetical protein HK12_10005 [Acetobacter orientalis]